MWIFNIKMEKKSISKIYFLLLFVIFCFGQISFNKAHASMSCIKDTPITSDWNGDGKTEIGVYRSSAHTWYFDVNNYLGRS